MLYQTESFENYIKVSATGGYHFRELAPFIDHLKSETQRLGAKRLLVDCSEIEGHVSDVDRFEGGQRIADIFGSSTRIALILATGTVTKLGELTAVNRGARLLVTDDQNEALNWLNR